MGKFIYESTVRVDFEDRLLAHLQYVIASKLRRGEAFIFAWRDDASLGGGRSSVWVHSHAALQFTFHGSRAPELSRDWLQALTFTANSPHGLHAVPEPAPGSVRGTGSRGEPMVFREESQQPVSEMA